MMVSNGMQWQWGYPIFQPGGPSRQGWSRKDIAARPQAVVSAKGTRHVEKMPRIFKCAKGASAAGSGLIMLKITLDWLDRLLSFTAWGWGTNLIRVSKGVEIRIRVDNGSEPPHF